jgi:hypothetical protein
MTDIRPQYHFRLTVNGLNAWSVRRLIDLSGDLPVIMINPGEVKELDMNHWYMHPSDQPTPRSVIEHLRLIQACDITCPVILDAQGRVMDGMHRVCRAIVDNVTSIPARRFNVDPEPDYCNCDPQALPYS